MSGLSGKSPNAIAKLNGEFLAAVVQVKSAHSLYDKLNLLLINCESMKDITKKMIIGMKTKDNGPILSKITCVLPANMTKSTTVNIVS